MTSNNTKLQYLNLKYDQKPIVWSAAGGSVIMICPSTRSTLRLSTGWLRVVVSPSTLLRTVSLSNGLSNHLVFVICYLKFFIAEHLPTRAVVRWKKEGNLEPYVPYNMLSDKTQQGSI